MSDYFDRQKAEAEIAAEEARRAEEQQQQRLTDLAAVLNDPAASRILWWVLSMCGVFRSTWDGEKAVEWSEGKRQIGIQIVAEIDLLGPMTYAYWQFKRMEAMVMESRATVETGEHTDD